MKLFLATVAALLVAGCSAAAQEDPGSMFDDEAQTEITCMKHQSAGPGPRYLDEQNWDSDVTLPLLRYYTANGRKSYCDGAGPTGVDQEWMDIYVRLGADRSNLLSRSGAIRSPR